MTQQTDRINAALAGRYRIDRHLGEGGMASVYLCEDLRHDRKVALKLLKPELAAVLGADRFVQEIKTTARLQHPHILPLFDSGTADGFLFYVMPFIEGETLREKLNRETQLGVDEAVRIAREVLDALEYAHRHGIVHRDVKPENILLHGGHAMVADFGIALAVSAAAGGRMTETGLSLGTPHYMSPEQATAEKEITPRSDLYSLGAVLYEMLTGNPPHVGSSAQQIIMRIITESPKPVSEVRRSVPANVAAAVAKSLEKLPADRFESARVFADALANPAFTTAASSGPSAHVAHTGPLRVREALAWTLAAAAITWATVLALTAAPSPVFRHSRFVLALPDSTPLAPARPSPARVAISRDGSKIAYVTERGGIYSIAVWTLADPVARIVAGTERGSWPLFSPSGEELAFVADGALKKVPVGGGTPTSIADSARGASWGTNGTIYFAGPGGIYRVSANGGAAKRISARDTTSSATTLGAPSVLPGDGYAVLTAVTPGGDTQLSIIELRNGAVTALGVTGFTPRYDGHGHLLFGRSDGTLYAVPFSPGKRAITGVPFPVAQGLQQPSRGQRVDYAVADDGTLVFVSGPPSVRQLLRVDRHGAATPLAPEERAFGWPKISPDGHRVALEIGELGQPRFDIWVYDIAQKNLSRLTTNSSGYRPVGWTSDGRRVLFVAGRLRQNGGMSAVLSKPWDNSGAADSLLHIPDYGLFDASIGPDHSWLAVRTVGTSTKGDIAIAPLDTPSKPRAFLNSPANELTPRLSPDGRFLAYSSDETGISEVYVRPVPGPGGLLKVSSGGGITPVWGPGGHEIFYRTASQVVAAAVSLGAEMTVLKRTPLFEDSYYAGPSPQFDVFPNGQDFLFIREVPGPGPQLNVIINWQALLRKP